MHHEMLKQKKRAEILILLKVKPKLVKEKKMVHMDKTFLYEDITAMNNRILK